MGILCFASKILSKVGGVGGVVGGVDEVGGV